MVFDGSSDGPQQGGGQTMVAKMALDGDGSGWRRRVAAFGSGNGQQGVR